jgi:hypothetical protein
MKNNFYLLIIGGVMASICFVLPTQVSLGYNLNPVLFAHFGFFLAIAIIGMYQLLKKKLTHFSFKMGCALIILSGVAHTIMATMQGANLSWYRKLKDALPEGMDKNELVNLFYGVFSSQSGVDFAFDIFISFGVFFMAISMLYNKIFGKVIPILGILISLVGYGFNAASFPNNPNQEGLIDPGPFFSVWFGLILIQIIILVSKRKIILSQEK